MSLATYLLFKPMHLCTLYLCISVLIRDNTNSYPRALLTKYKTPNNLLWEIDSWLDYYASDK